MSDETRLCLFDSELGWFALVGRGAAVSRLTFAHSSALAALQSVNGGDLAEAGSRDPLQKLARRLQAYARGKRDDFADVPLFFAAQTKFQQRVTDACRRIAPGKALSYAELAARVGSPGAARAVGNCMARNPIAIIVPCHRVLASGGGLGGYSMGSGLDIKRRLLELEGYVPKFPARSA